MFKPYFILGLLAGVISAAVSVVFAYTFNQKLLDFAQVLPYWKIIAVDFSLSLIAVGVYFGLSLIAKKNHKVVFYSLFSVASIASVLLPITANFPDLEFPEFYPTFAIPLHLIFSVIFLSLSSIIIKNEN
jgi:uncharacterized membrane protein YozB (DUF420 family)